MRELLTLCEQYLDEEMETEEFSIRFARIVRDQDVGVEVAQFLVDNWGASTR